MQQVERERAELALLKNRGEDLIKDEGNATVKKETPASDAKADLFITDSSSGVEHGFVSPSLTIGKKANIQLSISWFVKTFLL